MSDKNKQPAKLFIIYAREDAEFRHEFQKALTPLVKNNKIEIWSDIEIIAGEAWEVRIKEELKCADLIAVLISNNYFQSKFIHEVEIKEALARHERKETVLIPIIVRPCVWDIDETISGLQVLPSNGIPVDNQRYWGTDDLAWENVARGISVSLKLLKDNSNPTGRRVVLLQQQFIDDDSELIAHNSDSNGEKLTSEPNNIIENTNSKGESPNEKKFEKSLFKNKSLLLTTSTIALISIFAWYSFFRNSSIPTTETEPPQVSVPTVDDKNEKITKAKTPEKTPSKDLSSIPQPLYVNPDRIKRFYRVRDGENASFIANKFNMKMSEFQNLNSSIDISSIKSGKLVNIYDEITIKKHKVLKGETFQGIAWKHNMTTTELKKYNSDINTKLIKYGTTLTVIESIHK